MNAKETTHLSGAWCAAISGGCFGAALGFAIAGWLTPDHSSGRSAIAYTCGYIAMQDRDLHDSALSTASTAESAICRGIRMDAIKLGITELRKAYAWEGPYAAK